MSFSKKIKKYFSDKNLSNREVCELMNGYNEQLFSRQINSDEISITLVKRIITFFPDVDLNYLLKEDYINPEVSLISEPKEIYQTSSDILIEEIEVKLKELKDNLSQK